MSWLINDAWKATSASNFTAWLADALVTAEFPIWRLRLLVRTLTPQLFVRTYTWQRSVVGIQEYEAMHSGL